MSGIIASGLNGIGTVGVAWGSSLTGVNIFDSASQIFINSNDPAVFANFLSAVRQMASFDVTNNSWGATPNYSDSLAIANSFALRVNAEYAFVAANGRGGLGTVVVQSAGNSNLNANGDGLDASRYNITVGALLETGVAAGYSNFGANLLVSAAGGDSGLAVPGGQNTTVDGTRLIWTTDQRGTNGFNLRNFPPPHEPPNTSADYTNAMNGTSAAAPMVTGVVSLMLSANPGLGWRDVNDILAATALHTGSAIGAALPGHNENNTWFINHAGGWNGGGLHFSEDYGFGGVNAFAAVRMAEAYGIIGAAAHTSANEQTASTGTVVVNAAIPDLSTQTFDFNIAANIQVGQVAVTTNITHTLPGNINMFLVSAQGTEVQLAYSGSAGPGGAWTFEAEALRGELSAGT